VFAQARGHGDAPPAEHPGYAELAADLRAVADAHGATQALGVSLGAATLLRLLAETPDRFARVVLFLPAALGQPQPAAVRRSADLATVLESGDRAAVEAAVRAELPDDLTGAEAYVRARTAFLLGSDLGPLLRALPHEAPVPDPARLAAVTAQVLVIAQEGDPLHPVTAARAVAAALPDARLEVFGRPGVLFRERDRLRELVVGHLGGGVRTAPTG
jgi:pimeloyl-ACP methyl ester carboxylesterase